ncbi:MAG: hypothetical protein ACK5X3_10585, partial [Pseudomonadota bacterium]
CWRDRRGLGLAVATLRTAVLCGSPGVTTARGLRPHGKTAEAPYSRFGLLSTFSPPLSRPQAAVMVESPDSAGWFREDVWPSRWVTDLEIRAQPWGGLELAIGANNLFNTYPDQNPVGQGPDPITGVTRNFSQNNYFLPFSAFSPFGFNGRFLYGRVAYRF